MATFIEDAKYGLRLQAKNLGFTAISLLTIAISVGAVTTVFSAINAILLRPLSYPAAESIVIPWRLAPKDVNLGYEEIPWGVASFHRIRHDAQVFQSVAAFKSDSVTLTGAGEPVFLEGIKVSAEFLSVLGVQPLMGRGFTPADDIPGHEHKVILSYELWRRQFLSDKEILNRSINLNGELFSVVGVMPPGFTFPRGEEMPGSFAFPRRAQMWTPLALPLVATQGAPDELAVVGRLKLGSSLSQAQAEMQLLKSRMEQDAPDAKRWFNSRVTTLTKQVAGDTRMPLLLTFSAVGVVLLIACSNIANLLLTRVLGRSGEFSLRAALGASRTRLVSQLLIESLLLAIAGGGLGLLLASEGIHLLKVLGPSNIPRLQEVSLDLRVLGFAFFITLLSSILFGLAPALTGTRDLSHSIRAGSRGSGGSIKGATTRNVLLASEVALALVLMIASGLLAQTFFRLLKIDPGFRPERVLTFELSLPASAYKDEDHIVALYQKALLQLRALPGVESVGLTQMVPMNGATDGSRVRIPDRVAPGDPYPIVNYTIASSGYFPALGTPLLRGRFFTDSDNARSQPVVVINQSMARNFWPGKDPVGKQVALALQNAPLMTIVGVVKDQKHVSLREEPGPEMYVSFTQHPFPSLRVMHFAVRGKADPKLLASSIRSAIHLVDSDLPVAQLTTLQTIVTSGLAGQRFSMLLLSTFAGISLLLSACGIYGVISYSVTQQTREIGVRMALGATRRAVLGMVVGKGFRVAIVGILAGLTASMALTRLMAGFLYGVRPLDTPTFGIVITILLAVAISACYIPARRATQVDPIVALRYE